MHPVPEVAEQPQNIFELPPYLTLGTMFFSFIPFSINSRMTCFAKKLYLSLICTQNWLRLTQICSCKLQSGFFMPLCRRWGSLRSLTIALHFIQMTTYGSSWVCRTAWICVEDDWGCSSTIWAILHCILLSVFLYRPHPGRFAEMMHFLEEF